MNGLSRRRAIRTAGITSLGLAGTLVTATSAGAAAPAADPSEGAPRNFSLHGSGIRSSGQRKARAVGDSYLITGALSGQAGGVPDGQFFATATVVSRTHLADTSVTSLQTHTFVLPTGTLTGCSVLTLSGAGHCPITGGTGEYHGAQGSYAVQQDTDSFQGGTATYTFSLLPEKVAIHGR